MRDDWLNNGLPVYNCEKEKSEVRTMIDNMGGPGGFKTRIRTMADGSEITVQLKGDMPPQVSKTEPESQPHSDETIKRGYIARIKSKTITRLGVSVERFIKRAVSLWKDDGKAKDFNRYVVSGAAVEKPEVWVCLDDKVKLYSDKFIRTLSVDALGAFPIPYKDPMYPNSYSGDWGVLLVTSSGVKRKSANSLDVPELYNSSELEPNWASLATPYTSGVCFAEGRDGVGYNRLFVSMAGQMLQSYRRLKLDSGTVALSNSGQMSVPGKVYLFPRGDSTPNHKSGWDHPISGGTKFAFTMYVYNVAYDGSRYLVGTIDPAGKMTTDKQIALGDIEEVNFSGNDSFSASGAIGWFGEETVLSVAMSIQQTSKTTSEQGFLWNTSPVSAYPRSWTPSSPPFDRQYMLYAGGGYPMHVPELLEPGSRWSLSSAGVSSYAGFSSTSTASAVLNGAALCSINVSINGEATAYSGYRMLDDMTYPSATSEASNLIDTWNTSSDPIGVAMATANLILGWPVAGEREDVGGEETTPRTFSATMVTRDYILYDPPNKTYIYLEGSFGSSGLLSQESGSSHITLELVIERNDSKYRKPIAELGGGAFAIYYEDGQTGFPYHPLPVPYTGFAPKYCTQGDFPYAAYSEKNEVGHGVFLLSMPFHLVTSEDEKELVDGVLNFLPRHFMFVMKGYGNVFDVIRWVAALKTDPVYIHFADGEFHNWVADVYPNAVNDKATFSEVYRT